MQTSSFACVIFWCFELTYCKTFCLNNAHSQQNFTTSHSNISQQQPSTTPFNNTFQNTPKTSLNNISTINITLTTTTTTTKITVLTATNTQSKNAICFYFIILMRNNGCVQQKQRSTFHKTARSVDDGCCLGDV